MALLVVGACSDDGVDPITKITSPRVLAITSEPSVLTIDGTLQLTAFTVDPDRPRSTEVRLRACAPWKIVSEPDRDCVGSDAMALGTDELSAAALQAAFPSPPGINAPPDPWGAAIAAGIRLQIPIIAEVLVDGVTLVARRDVEVVDRGVVRSNPRVVDVRFDGIATTTLQAGTAYALTVSIDPASLDVPPGGGSREQVDIYFYSPAGELADPRVELEDPDAEAPGSEPTTYTAGPRGSSWLFVVTTDDTGGMGLVSVPLEIQ